MTYNKYSKMQMKQFAHLHEQVEAQPIQQVRMKTLRERKQEKYNDMMENAF